jgi:hypothetical protein
MTWTPPQRPAWVERLNALEAAAGGPGALVSLNAEALLAQAADSTGLSDFGDDTGWREHYAVLVDALERESSLHLAGRLLARSELLRTLRNRLQLAELWKREPAILDADLDAPVFVVGSPRSGTSILHELLACDPASRAPLMWEMAHPVEALSGESMRRVADDTTRFWHDLQPEYESMHANSGDLPNECIFITMHEMLSEHWGGCHVVPSYDAHLARADHRPAFRYHRRFLQTLQGRSRGERWLLKAPSHLFHLREIFEVYPNARVIMTHRDPLQTLPSALSLLATLKWMRCSDLDMSAAGPRMAYGYGWIYQKLIEQRADGTLPDDNFVDIRFSDLMADPAVALGRLYDGLGWKLPSDVEAAMARYIAEKPRGAHGVHRYALEDWGLAAAEERDRFRFYCERFGLDEEG